MTSIFLVHENELNLIVSNLIRYVICRYTQDLNAEHYAMEKVKRRILEYLAVRQLNNSLKGPILCFVGPPGVGKTSIGKSIANTIGRKFHRYVQINITSIKVF